MKNSNCKNTLSKVGGTKAETLSNLSDVDAFFVIPEFYFFDRAAWEADQAKVLEKIRAKMPRMKLAVRSSAIDEDTIEESRAGAYDSFLDVSSDHVGQLRSAIENVFSSYGSNNDWKDQVLVQKMVNNVDVSGVIMTRAVDDGAPYYVFNYDDESGNTDSITGGVGANKTVFVYRDADESNCHSQRLRQMLRLARSLEEIVGKDALDIEFAIDQAGTVYLLQLRFISAKKNWIFDSYPQVSRRMPEVERFVSQLSDRRPDMYGSHTILANMPDWNPAEIIGVHPSPLAASLYRYLITSDTWCIARRKMGYHDSPTSELMVLVASSPYIDMRASFNSFLPKGVQKDLAEKLVNTWLQRVYDHPELHDKIEFDVVPTVYDFDTEATFAERYPDLLTSEYLKDYFERLKTLTSQLVSLDEKASLSKALKLVEVLKRKQEERFFSPEQLSIGASQVFWIHNALKDCIRYGTIPFSIIARHGFIAEAFLRSMVRQDILSQERVEEFKASFSTVLGEFAEDSQKYGKGELSSEDYLNMYGHLRPGTYDIQALPYHARNDLNFPENSSIQYAGHECFQLTADETLKIDQAFQELGFDALNAQAFMDYSAKAIQGREYAKFIFTKSVSAVLDAIGSWGQENELDLEGLSLLKIEDILDTAVYSYREDAKTDLREQIDLSRDELKSDRLVKLGYLIRDTRDLYVIPVHRSSPNFITDKRIESEIIHLNKTDERSGVLEGKIVCIENADPGFDWIFTQNIGGLITKFGGANSHMAIRCSELKIPAAIGCGELIFSRLKSGTNVLLSCTEKTIK